MSEPLTGEQANLPQENTPPHKDPHTVVEALNHVALALSNAGTLLESLERAFKDRTEKFGRMLRLQSWMLLAGVIMLPIIVWSSLNTFATTTTIREVTNPKSQYAQEASKRTQTLLVSLAEENDCRARRAKVGLPAPTPTSSCRAQTPADVYPGG